MSGVKLNPNKVFAELTQLSEQLLQSFSTLQQLEEVSVGQTPKEIIYREDKLQLLHYHREKTPGRKRCRTPLLICYALVNRPYMVDLDQQRSFVKRLLALGLDIYLIDWGYPDAADRYLDMDDYINGYITNCVEQVLKDSGQEQLNLLGICQGGTLSLCYTALNPDKIKNLITMVTPVDFKTPDNMLSHLAQQIDIDLAVETYGNIPGALLNDAYNALMPMRLGLQKNLNIPRQLKNPTSALNFLRMEKWIYDSPDQAGEMFRQFLNTFFKHNGFINNTARVGDRPIDLQKITQPILNIFGNADHLVPPSASQALHGLTNSQDYHEYAVTSGHIGVFVSAKSQTEVAPAIARWLKQHE